MAAHDPTTLRFSRRAGEAVRDSDYARSIEGPESGVRGTSAVLVLGIVAMSFLAAVLLVV